ncbi:MAG: type II toxin-antitoxin system VapC family toxin [Thermoplasmata archaeon]|nr:MAG: type II toxin-antitoxin system VapC family toxin [Thermoplasmata archaeon]
MIILDTNVFSNAYFCKWVAQSDQEIIISSISYTELAYHYLKKGKDMDYLDSFIQNLGVRVVEYTHEQAKIAAKLATKKWDFRKNARDYMVASLAIKENAFLITYNVNDFAFLSKNKLFTPEEFMKRK